MNLDEVNMKQRCSECMTRCRLATADWDLVAATNAANVHKVAQVRTQVVGTLSMVQYNKDQCGRCEAALAKAHEFLRGGEDDITQIAP